MKLPFFHIMTNEKYSKLVVELKRLNSANESLEMWYTQHLTEINKLRDLHSKEKERKLQYIQNFCRDKEV